MSIGLYIHVPFCRSKCPYCDFYSAPPSEDIKEAYIAALLKRAAQYSDMRFDTVYFGGGTPSLLGADNIERILSRFNIDSGAEITVECNPSDSCSPDGFDFKSAAAAGVNRISLGLQSAVDEERRKLGRRAGAEQVSAAIERARATGISNISLDLMLGIISQTEESLTKSLDFCINSGAAHISAYMLKIESGTYFHKIRDKLDLPDEDETCDLYLKTCDVLESAGFEQYEISNFATPGHESRHNLKYWHCEEYLGLGPAAHSYIDGKRFYFERDTAAFIDGAQPVDDGTGGDFEEYAMLALRLNEGLREDLTRRRFGFGIPKEMMSAAKNLEGYSLLKIHENGISLTRKGFLVSNSVIAELLSK